MFKSLTDKLSKSLGEDTLLPVPSLDQADNCRPLSIVVKKNRRWFWRAPKYLPSQYTLSQLLSNKEDLDVPIINEDLTNFDDVSSFSVKGKIGAKIASEVDLDVKASDDIQMSSKLGQIVKNKVNIPILQDLLTRKKLNLTHPFIEEIRQNYRNVLCVVVGSLCTTKDCQLVAKLLREKEQGADVGSQGPIQGEEDVSVVDDQTRVIRIPADKPVSYHVCELHITTEGGIRLLILGEGTGGFDKPDEEKFVDIDVGEDEPDNPFIDRTESTNPFDDPEPNHYEPFKSIVSLEFADRYWLTHWLHSLLRHPAMIDSMESLIGQAHGLLTNNDTRECNEKVISRHLEGKVSLWKMFFEKLKFKFQDEKVNYPSEDSDGYIMAVHCVLASMAELSDEQCAALYQYNGEQHSLLLHLLRETIDRNFCPSFDDPLVKELFSCESPAKNFAESLEYDVVKLSNGEEMLQLTNPDMVVLEGAWRTVYAFWGK